MGCAGSAQADGERVSRNTHTNNNTSFKKPKWKSQDPVTPSELQKLRDEFWETAPHYGGDAVIWEALKAASTVDVETARVILEAAEIIIASPDLTVCYDGKGRKYDIPVYVLSDPRNLAREDGGG